MRRPLDLPVVVTQPFGSTAFDYSPYGLKGHHGVDYAAEIGRDVFAPEDAIVIASQNGYTDPKSGRFAAGEIVVLQGRYEHWLMHLSVRFVIGKQKVTEGQLIGRTGNTGISTGPHLHWGTRPLNPDMNNGYRGFIDPAIVLKEGEKTMITEKTLTIFTRFYLGRDPNDSEKSSYVGKLSPDETAEKIRTSGEYQAHAAAMNSALKQLINHFPGKIRA